MDSRSVGRKFPQIDGRKDGRSDRLTDGKRDMQTDRYPDRQAAGHTYMQGQSWRGRTEPGARVGGAPMKPTISTKLLFIE